jgi:hypothetical protein
MKAVTRNGEIVGRGTAYCMRDESKWASRPIHGLASMAQTRATSKALKGPLGFIVQLAGYATTPAEEMPDLPDQKPDKKTDDRKANPGQHARLAVEIKKLNAERPNTDWEALSKDLATSMFGVKSRAELSVTQMSELINALPTADVPF